MRTYEPERALIARETYEENRKDLAKMLDQIAMERAARLPPSFPRLLSKSRSKKAFARFVRTSSVPRTPRPPTFCAGCGANYL